MQGISSGSKKFWTIGQNANLRIDQNHLEQPNIFWSLSQPVLDKIEGQGLLKLKMTFNFKRVLPLKQAERAPLST